MTIPLRRRGPVAASLVMSMAALVGASGYALAGGGNGGNAFPTGNGAGGGATGPTAATNAGGNGGTSGNNNGGGGGGGGAGSGASNGGTGGTGGGSNTGGGIAGGAGGTAGSPNGVAGSNTPNNSNSGAGGGGGGYSAFSGATLDNSTVPVALTGGNGGAGGNRVGGGNAAGGGGGEGGYGAVITGAGTSTNAGTITGGTGGAGGSGQNNGAGGSGGVGIFFSAAGATLTNTGTISGGSGGNGGGTGGIGILGSGLTIDNTGGTINGGQAGGGGARNFALQFTGGANFASYTGTYNGGINVTGGSFAPALTGSAIGTTLSTTGPLVLSPGTFYNIRLSPTANDSVTATGAATLTGATVNATFANGAYVARQYTILTASGLGGTTFAGINNTNQPANTTSTLSYDATHAYIDLALTFAGPGFPGGLNTNQQNVANALTNFFNSTGGIPAVFANLNGNGLSQASNEGATGTQQVTYDAMNLFMGVMTDPTSANRDGAASSPAQGYAADDAMAYAGKNKPRDALAAIYRKAPPRAFEERWSVWTAGFGGSRTTDGNVAVGSNTTTSRIYGGAVGADYRFSPFTVAGFALAGGGTNYSIANSGTGRSDLFQAGGFVRHNIGPSYITAAVAYGWQDVTTDRTVTIAGIDQLRARFNSNALTGRLEAGNRFVIANLGVTPYAAGQVTTIFLPNTAEIAISGANTFATTTAARDVTSPRSELGFRTDKSYALTDSVLSLRGRAAWAHDFDPQRAIGVTFQTLPGASFVVNGAAQARDSALVTAGAEISLRNNWTLASTFEGEFSNVTQSYAGKGVARYSW